MTAQISERPGLCRRRISTAAARSETPSLRTIAVMCARTALGVIVRLSAICAVDSPSDRSWSTSHSRLVKRAFDGG